MKYYPSNEDRAESIQAIIDELNCCELDAEREFEIRLRQWRDADEESREIDPEEVDQFYDGH